jgi:hypothetical protein
LLKYDIKILNAPEDVLVNLMKGFKRLMENKFFVTFLNVLVKGHASKVLILTIAVSACG